MAVCFLVSLAAGLVACGGGSGKSKDNPPVRGSQSPGPSRNKSSQVQPKKAALNEKEKMIQAGLKTGKNAYPTVDDVPSDWSDPKSKKKEEAGEKKTDEKKKIEVKSSQEKDKKGESSTSRITSGEKAADDVKKSLANSKL